MFTVLHVCEQSGYRISTEEISDSGSQGASELAEITLNVGGI